MAFSEEIYIAITESWRREDIPEVVVRVDLPAYFIQNTFDRATIVVGISEYCCAHGLTYTSNTIIARQLFSGDCSTSNRCCVTALTSILSFWVSGLMDAHFS